MRYDPNIYYGYLVQGNLTQAMKYLRNFPEKSELHDKYVSIFENQQYITYTDEPILNHVLLCYQQYFRDVFYLNLEADTAAENLRCKLVSLLCPEDPASDLSAIEDTTISDLFSSYGFHFLGGRTGGYYGPYIWRQTEQQVFDVELPDGIQEYPIHFLTGFLMRSWLDYLSFGAVGTGGWTNGDGIINCIKDSYDLQSEAFTVSLLKHEAQHARDLKNHPNMCSADLEYRAKLVELIYSNQRDLLTQFRHEADHSQQSNGHSIAANRIISEFTLRFPQNAHPPIGEVQAFARELLANSTKELAQT